MRHPIVPPVIRVVAIDPQSGSASSAKSCSASGPICVKHASPGSSNGSGSKQPVFLLVAFRSRPLSSGTSTTVKHRTAHPRSLVLPLACALTASSSRSLTGRTHPPGTCHPPRVLCPQCSGRPSLRELARHTMRFAAAFLPCHMPYLLVISLFRSTCDALKGEQRNLRCALNGRVRYRWF